MAKFDPVLRGHGRLINSGVGRITYSGKEIQNGLISCVSDQTLEKMEAEIEDSWNAPRGFSQPLNLLVFTGPHRLHARFTGRPLTGALHGSAIHAQHQEMCCPQTNGPTFLSSSLSATTTSVYTSSQQNFLSKRLIQCRYGTFSCM